MRNDQTVAEGSLTVRAPASGGSGESRTRDWSLAAALVPAATVGVFQFGSPALAVLAGGVGGCLAVRALAGCVLGWERFVPPGRAVLSGLLLGMNLPPTSPAWLILAGCSAAVLGGAGLRRTVGLGRLHPTVLALAFLLAAFPATATRWSLPVGLFGAATEAAAVTSPGANGLDIVASLVGRVPGGAGTTSLLALALGGFFLLSRRIAHWQAPAAFVCGFAAPAALLAAVVAEGTPDLGALSPSGGVVVAALFVVADPAASPSSPGGRLFYGAGCGALTWLLRFAGGQPDGVWFAILLMSMVTPLIEMYSAAAPSAATARAGPAAESDGHRGPAVREE